MAKKKASKGAKAEEIPPQDAIALADVNDPLGLDVVDQANRAAALERADELAMLGRMTPTERAMFEFGLEARHILASREYPQPDGVIEVAILTQGGQRLRWPQDAGRVLSDMEKGDGKPVPVPAGIFSR